MASVVKVLPASAMQFAVYDSMSDMLHMMRRRNAQDGAAASSSPQLFDKLLAGIVAGAASCSLTYPLETVRTMMSVPGIAQGNFVQATAQALRQYGPVGLYAGFRSSLLGDMLGTGLGFAAYETGALKLTKLCAAAIGQVLCCSSLIPSVLC